ncbi:MAG: phosphoadenosine phosphosulfate reductase family protein [Rhodospirillaceae bacterium]|mgnify:FL=1|jgi:phosphoadenosine phosphosulfate reductase|nr:phosphoadenosine phosphosulfate reductase family protein [Rhodospirillaceae bacterium]MBT5457052.1 phosphoadenosine phosphosulfate reductase family protein [Rhodospirillaceae bacterium]
MLRVEELRKATTDMTAPELLRCLLVQEFPDGCAVTSALRARSVVVLHMIAEIDLATPVIFCHAPYIFPESVEYRARIVRQLGLTDVRDPAQDETEILPQDQGHTEGILSDASGGGTIHSTVNLNKSLAGFNCWISAAYHRPYGDDPTPRLIEEGRLLRVDPLMGWTQKDVHAYMAERDLPHHPRIAVPTYHY